MPRTRPERVDPAELARTGERLAGTLSGPRLSRIAPRAGEIAYDLGFAFGDGARVRIEGSVRGALELVCQRCLEPLEWPVEARVDLTVVDDDEQAAALEEEAVVAREGTLDVAALVEDETILALPPAPAHADGECTAPAGADEVPRSQPRTHRPFEVLAEIRTGAAPRGNAPRRRGTE